MWFAWLTWLTWLTWLMWLTWLVWSTWLAWLTWLVWLTWLMWFCCPKIWYDEPNFIVFFIFSVVTGFFCFATSENFHLSKSSDNAFLFRKLCILSLISDQKLHFLYMYNQNSNNDALVVLFAISSIKANLLKGLASYCKAETTFTFYFTILPLSRAFLSINNREMKSESGFSFAMASSQPFEFLNLKLYILYFL